MDSPGTGWTPNTALCSRWTTYSADAQAYALRVATRVIWAATGRRFGLESQTVRPSRPAQMPLYQTFPAGFRGYGFWTLFGTGDGWTVANTCGCLAGDASYPFGACGCGGASIALPGTVSAVTEVVIDGVALDPSAYTLSGGYLTRQDGKNWPAWQNFSIPDNQTGTWSVTWTQGEAVPDDLNDAAGLYACQVGAAVTGGSCQLPNRVQQVTRQGVTIDYVNPGEYLNANRTGYDAVDSIIVTYNPKGLTQRPRFVSPDLPQYRR